jgi:hypothetical protein
MFPNVSEKAYQDVLKNLRTFIELSLLEDEKTWSEWISNTAKKITTNCWEKKQCLAVDCPAYESDCGRCWLMAGTLCGGEVQGKFAIKYSTCYDCEVFQEAVFKNPVNELQEHILILIHSLRTKQHDLKEALVEVKTLSGLIPICMTCKKNSRQHWVLESIRGIYLRILRSGISHGLCPECLKKHYPPHTI